MAIPVLPSVVELSLSTFFRTATIAALVTLLVGPLQAKEQGLTAIELYNGPAGPAYVQITSFLINGKLELRACGSAPKLTKSDYGKLPKITLAAGASIEDGSNGALTLTQGETSVCVVPGNLKFEKNAAFTPSEAATRAILQGLIVSADSNPPTAPPPFAPGVKIVFVDALDVELAEFLRAEHSPSIPLWRNYLGKYPAALHSAKAKEFLASLLVKDGENNLAAYRKSLPGPPRSFPNLNSAEQSAEQAVAVVPAYAPAIKLKVETHDELTKLINEGWGEIRSYKRALTEHTSGYAHLLAAHELANVCVQVDSHFETSLNFQAETNENRNTFDSSLASAGALMDAKRFDESYARIAPYASFAGEVPGVAAIIDATYQFHFDAGKRAGDSKDWEAAIKEYHKAADTKPTNEVAVALKDAEEHLEAVRNQNAANQALAQSHAVELEHDYIEAYEVLDRLPSAQRSLLSSDLERLAPAYIDSVPKAADDIQKAHDPIRGLADELAILRAYHSLQTAYSLSQNPSLKDRADNLGDKLSEYYLVRGKHYMDKPQGSGAGLGWTYLNEALEYKASNLDAVRDERTKAVSAHKMRSTLSIRVVFRDQTSRRDSAGFAAQLEDGITTGLETSGFPGWVIRPSENPAFEPNFELVGDVLEHHPTRTSESKPRESRYRAGEQSVPNPEWNKTNREYESAVEELHTLQQELSGISAHGKKKQIDEATNKITAAEKKVNEVHIRLDSLPQNLPVDIIKPYTYSVKTIVVSALVQLQFRIRDLAGDQIIATVPLKKEREQKYQILENVKPEDTEGVKPQASDPDETQLLTDDENDARDALIKAVAESAAKLPEIVFERGQKKEEEGDQDGAAESYILYLNSTPPSKKPERRRAENFLLDRYNIHWNDSNPGS